MEGSTVSPPPASPNEGDDLCEIDVTNVAINSVTLLTCLCGLAGNGVVLWLLGFRIRRNPITVYILNLAFANFNFLLFGIPSTLLYLMADVSCYTITSLMYVRLLFLLSLFSYNLGLYLLTAISIERCTSILCPIWYHCRRPQRQSQMVCALLWALSIAVMVTVTSLCQSQEHEHCQVALISMYALNLFIFAPSLLISRTFLLVKVLCGSREQQRLHMVISFVVLLILLFTLPLSLWNFLQELGYTTVSSQVVFLLTCIHSSINPFMYFLVGRCWRHCSMGSLLLSLQLSLQRVFEEPEENTPSSNDATRDTTL